MAESLFQELRRRKVLRVAAGYVVAAWVLLQVADVVSEPLGLPIWYQTVLIYVLAALFGVVVTISWFYDLTTLGFIRDSGPFRDATSPTFIQLDDPSRQRLAVLPLVAMAGSHDDEFLGDGIAEEILNTVARHKDLGVIARTSSFRFRGVGVNMTTLRQELGATHVVSGSVRRSGDQVRVSVQLINAGTESQIWSESFQRGGDDIFMVQRDVARSVDRALVTVIGLEPLKSHREWKLAPAAYELYLRARAAFWRGDFPNTLKLAGESASIDPENPLVPTLVSEVFLYWPRYGFAATRDHLEKARHNAAQALEADDEFPRARAAKGMLALYMERDFKTAFDSVSAAALQDPDVAEWLPALLTYADRFADAAEIQRRIAQRDPLNPFNLFTWANRVNWMGKTEEAMAIVARGREIDPTHLILSNIGFRWTLRKGDVEGAKAMLTEWGLDPENPTRQPSHDWLPLSVALWLGSRLYGEMGDLEMAYRLASKIEQEEGFTPTTVTEAYINAGAIDDAYRVWDLGISRFDPGAYDIAMPQDMRDPESSFWLNFRADPRFEENLERLGIHKAAFDDVDWAVIDRVLV